MKKLSLSILAALLFTVGVSAQASKAVGGPEAEKYDLGGQIVRVPTPAAFTNVFLGHDEYAARFKASRPPGIELLAVFAADDDLARMKKGEQEAFDVYAKLSIATQVKSMDIGPELFADIAKSMNDRFAEKVDPVRWKGIVDAAKKAQYKALGSSQAFDVSTPQSFGNFESTDTTNSVLLLMTLREDGTSQQVLCSASMLRVKNRVIQLYVYRPARAEDDPEKLRQFAKSWNAAIIAANK